MAVLVTHDTRVLVQGITGNEGSYHAQVMMDYGTKVVGGTSLSKAGQTFLGVPVFAAMHDAVKATGANSSIIFIPAFQNAADAIMEAADAGIGLIVCLTEGIPVLDMVKVIDFLSGTEALLIGPNCPGVITPGVSKVGFMPSNVFSAGRIGLVSRSGTLTYEVANLLTRAGIGISTCVGIGGDPIIGTTFTETLRLFNDDPDTDLVVLLGEVGGGAEEEAAAFVKAHGKKPVVSFISGRTVPPGKRMGHAGAIISGNSGTPQAKVDAMQAAGIPVADTLEDIPGLVQQGMKG
jgi:succinyl-CoA synthetase alpha subunit